MTSKKFFKYGFRYGIYYASLWLFIALIGYFFPELKNFSATILAMAFSSLGTLDFFVKNEKRLPNRSEYWSLVGISVLVSFVLESSILLGIVLLFSDPLPSVGFFVIVLAAGEAVNLIVAMICYSKFFGRRALDRARKTGSDSVVDAGQDA